MNNDKASKITYSDLQNMIDIFYRDAGVTPPASLMVVDVTAKETPPKLSDVGAKVDAADKP